MRQLLRPDLSKSGLPSATAQPHAARHQTQNRPDQMDGLAELQDAETQARKPPRARAL